MKVFGNILWFILVGFWLGLANFIMGAIWCITIVGIPFGVQLFKIAILKFFPFGKKVKTNFAAHPVANTIWIIFGGFVEFAVLMTVGVVLCIFIVTIPIALQVFKFGLVSLMPFGAKY